MRTDALVRELHTEAEEATRWTAPWMDQLRRGRARQRRRRAVAGGLMTALAAAAVAGAVVVPRGLGDASGPAPLGPAASPTTTPPPASASAGTRDWATVACPPVGGCELPGLLSVGGTTLWSPAAGIVPTHHGRVRSAHDTISVDRRHSPVWVLVGATGSTTRSDLAVRFGHGRWRPLAPGRLTLLPLPPGDDRIVEVRVREAARPLPREVLSIGVYRPRPPVAQVPHHYRPR